MDNREEKSTTGVSSVTPFSQKVDKIVESKSLLVWVLRHRVWFTIIFILFLLCFYLLALVLILVWG